MSEYDRDEIPVDYNYGNAQSLYWRLIHDNKFELQNLQSIHVRDFDKDNLPRFEIPFSSFLEKERSVIDDNVRTLLALLNAAFVRIEKLSNRTEHLEREVEELKCLSDFK